MSRYSAFYLNSSSSVVKLDLLSFTHPNFTREYNVVRNSIAGITVTLETSVVQDFEYYPLQLVPTGSDSDLDQTLKIILGDLGELLPKEIDAVQVAGTFKIKPTLIYRQYRSDDLTLPIEGPHVFSIENVVFNGDGANLNAAAPRVNLTGTGRRYTFDRFPMLRGI